MTVAATRELAKPAADRAREGPSEVRALAGLGGPQRVEEEFPCVELDLEFVFALEGLLKCDREVSLLLAHDRSADLLECAARSREIVVGLPELACEPVDGLTAAFEISSIEVDD